MGVQVINLPKSSGHRARASAKVRYLFRVRDDRDGRTYDVIAQDDQEAISLAGIVAGRPVCSPVVRYLSTVYMK